MRLTLPRPVLLAIAALLIVAAPIVGLLPGPGGVFVFAGGLVLLLRNSAWARRRFAAAKRRWPRLGGFVDRVLRRPSAARRRALEAERLR